MFTNVNQTELTSCSAICLPFGMLSFLTLFHPSSNPDLSASYVPTGWVKIKKEICDHCYSSTKAVVDGRTIVFYGLFWCTVSVFLWAWCFHTSLSYFCISRGHTVSLPKLVFFILLFFIGVPCSLLCLCFVFDGEFLIIFFFLSGVAWWVDEWRVCIVLW